jgi:hypothetical protein
VVKQDKTNGNERWIGDGWKTGDVDRRTQPEQGEEPTSAEVVTNLFKTINLVIVI